VNKNVIAALLLAASPAAMAGSADSTGGIKVKSDDGRFEGSVGGLLHYDFIDFSPDQVDTGYSEGPYVRRAELAIGGKAFDFKYKLAADLKGSATESKDMWIGTSALGGFIKAGHLRPASGMQLQTSSSELLFTERPYISNNTLYTGREYQNGLAYDAQPVDGLTVLLVGYSANPAAEKSASATQASTANGYGASARVSYAPLMTESGVVHVGASYDTVDWARATPDAPAVSAPIVGRNAPTLALLAAGTYDGQQTPVVELGARFGRFYVAGEYSVASYDLIAGGEQELTAYYVETSVFLTGESKPYRADKGVFGNPTPASVEWGALELKARYDSVENEDAAGEPQATMLSAGLNYYFNANARVMADYNLGKAEVAGASDEPRALVLRGQLSF
jgi:phosphate-selective porin OprO and OprP